MEIFLFLQICGLVTMPSFCQSQGLGRFHEVFAWKQMTYDIGGVQVFQDRFAENNLVDSREKRSSDDSVYFSDDGESDKNWEDRSMWTYAKPIEPSKSPAAVNPSDEIGRFFIQYNNVPMGAERVGNRLFITIPRRRYGIPSTINYIELPQQGRSPPLSPYPDMQSSRSVISVYRTRADECGRLWAVDTGAIEIPNNVTYLQSPAIIVYDLNTNRQILRYQLKRTDLPATNTATGLASITIDIRNGDCFDAYAYIPDVVTNGVIVFSLRQNNSWRQSHNYFSFMPTAGNLRVAGQSFQWNDGVFSVTLGARAGAGGCRAAYFHPLVSRQEFVVSTCELQQPTANQSAFTLVGERGSDSQSTMHGLHAPTNVIFFADIGRDAISCWNADKPLTRDNVVVLARDENRISYPSDLHVSGDEVWVIANSLPRFIYSRLDPDQYNFFVYKANVQDLISGTACESDTNTAPVFGSSPQYQGHYSRQARNRYS